MGGSGEEVREEDEEAPRGGGAATACASPALALSLLVSEDTPASCIDSRIA